jgi:hypothetical protein
VAGLFSGDEIVNPFQTVGMGMVFFMQSTQKRGILGTQPAGKLLVYGCILQFFHNQRRQPGVWFIAGWTALHPLPNPGGFGSIVFFHIITLLYRQYMGGKEKLD